MSEIVLEVEDLHTYIGQHHILQGVSLRVKRDAVTVLLVEHKIDMIMALSDSIAVLKDGRLIADDTPEAISRNAEVQAAYFGGGGA